MLPAALMAPLAGAGLVTAIRWILASPAISPKLARDPQRWERVVLAGALIGCTATMAIHASKPMHAKQGYVKEAGLWIAQRRQPGQRIASNQFLVQHYGGDDQLFSLRGPIARMMRENPSWTPARATEEAMALSVAYAQEKWGQGFAFVAIQAPYLQGELLDESLLRQNWHRVATFSRVGRYDSDDEVARKKANPPTIFVYQAETNP